MIVLIEGPDGAGKTTLSNEFIARGYEYVHLGKVDDINQTYKDLIYKMRLNKNLVIDRGILSNLIYSTVFGGELVDIELAIEFIGLCDQVVLCLPKDKLAYYNKFETLKKERVECYDNMYKVFEYYMLFAKVYARLSTFSTYDKNEISAEQFCAWLLKKERT